mmetsp:Transcript_23134/g.33593  ORF Transcript_23134/g.33593 Transcript_23134/m.33593 type:complete len:219 (-) Transcript_23134:2603-3259(-)
MAMSLRNSSGSLRPVVIAFPSILLSLMHLTAIVRNFSTSSAFISSTNKQPFSTTLAPRATDPSSFPAPINSSKESTASSVSPPTKYSLRIFFAFSPHSSGLKYVLVGAGAGTGAVAGASSGTEKELFLVIEFDESLLSDLRRLPLLYSAGSLNAANAPPEDVDLCKFFLLPPLLSRPKEELPRRKLEPSGKPLFLKSFMDILRPIPPFLTETNPSEST